jgi:NAD(P)H-hydrate epimerase
MASLDSHLTNAMHIPSRILMENAAFGITEAISGRFGADTHIAAVCGTGNNGGDGFAAARQLCAKGYSVCVYLVGAAGALRG